MIIIGCTNQKKETKTESNSEKEKFVWDFNSDNIYVYSFEQIMNQVSNWSEYLEDVDTNRVIGIGELSVKSKGNNKADFVLNLKIENTAFESFKEGIPPQTIVIPEMDANGQFELKRRNSDLMIDLIFPLPSKDLQVGENEEIELEIPLNLMGSPLYVKGNNKLKYLKDTDAKTALIKSEFKIDKLNVPKEIKGEFMCSLIGTSEFEFNYEKKYFKSSKVDLQIKMKSKVDNSENGIGKVEMYMESTTRYDIKFIKIER